jgi:flavin reductase (DIM6/NTAB) family NADH-FMN oxidoreductase RutF
MFSYTYQNISKLMMMFVSVTLDTGNGCANLATASNSLSLLYSPTVVMYGLKYEPVAKSDTIPLFELPEINDGFCENVNSF